MSNNLSSRPDGDAFDAWLDSIFMAASIVLLLIFGAAIGVLIEIAIFD